MDHPPLVPSDFELVRTTNRFTTDTAPRGLLRAHQVAEGVWGRLIVDEGEVGFVFEDSPTEQLRVGAGESLGIPPQRLHHVVPLGPARFAVEFYRRASADESGVTPPSRAGAESTGLTD